jgi:hypothetical protein
VIGSCGDQTPAMFSSNNFSGLVCLYLDGNYSAGVMTSLLNATPCLHDLRFSEASVDDAGLQALRNHASKLRTLVLLECGKITNAGAVALAQKCVSLTCLDIAQCPQLSDVAVQNFAASCPRLETIQLQGSFTCVSARSLALRCGKSLKHVSFKNMTFTNDISLCAVADRCKGLEELLLESCTGLTAEGLLSLVSKLPGLKELAITGCDTLTDAVLSALAEIHPELETLSLYKSSGYTSIGALAVMRTLKQLRGFAVESRHAIFSSTVLGLWNDFMPDLDTDFFYANVTRFEVLGNFLDD